MAFNSSMSLRRETVSLTSLEADYVIDDSARDKTER
jgi:hypothetical protein